MGDETCPGVRSSQSAVPARRASGHRREVLSMVRTMVRSRRIAADADPLDARRDGVPSARLQLPADRKRRWLRRLLGATSWIVGGMALFVFYLRISFTGHVTSDAANNALQ